MADVTLQQIDELEGHQGMFLNAGRALGVTAWGMNILARPLGPRPRPFIEATPEW